MQTGFRGSVLFRRVTAACVAVLAGAGGTAVLANGAYRSEPVNAAYENAARIVAPPASAAPSPAARPHPDGNLSVVVPVTPPYSQMVAICREMAGQHGSSHNPWLPDLERETGGTLPGTRSWCGTFLRIHHDS